MAHNGQIVINIFFFREAKSNGHVCPQHMYYKPDIWVGKEDCLWLNVFTRDLVVKKRRPVIVWIHGGNFVRGSAADYDPDYIMDQDVVLVTIQYRSIFIKPCFFVLI